MYKPEDNLVNGDNGIGLPDRGTEARKLELPAAARVSSETKKSKPEASALSGYASMEIGKNVEAGLASKFLERAARRFGPTAVQMTTDMAVMVGSAFTTAGGDITSMISRENFLLQTTNLLRESKIGDRFEELSRKGSSGISRIARVADLHRQIFGNKGSAS